MTIAETTDGITGRLVVSVQRQDGSGVPGMPVSVAFSGEEEIHGLTIDNVETGARGELHIDLGQAYKLDLYVEREYRLYRQYRVRVRPLGPIDGVSYCFASAEGKVLQA